MELKLTLLLMLIGTVIALSHLDDDRLGWMRRRFVWLRGRGPRRAGANLRQILGKRTYFKPAIPGPLVRRFDKRPHLNLTLPKA